MAPAQSRQLLIWSLPTLVLLFGFFWYKRKKSFFQTDPGGKDNISIKQSSDTSKIIATTSNKVDSVACSSYVDDDDDEYTVFDLKFSSTVTSPVKENSILESEEVSELPLDCSGFNNSYSVTSSTLNPKTTFEIIDLCTPKKIQAEPELICLLDSSDSEIDRSDSPQVEEFIIKKSISTEECSNPMVKKRKQISSESSLAESNLTEPSSCSLNEESTDVQESDKENISLNCNTNEADGFKNPKVLSNGEELPAPVNNPCNDTTFQNELDNILVNNMAEEEVVEEKSESDAGIENKLSNLGLNTAHSLEKPERDSANHSPAEVMLGSPSICHFSDEHSEGSSDSGKGCSDVVTPPSRTPAGGSSVAGDHILSVYEFVLEQHIVGRLIGRHGTYLQEIRGKTNTNLFIKRHPETTKLKICAVEGTQQDIEAALAMIRQKFPLRRFPNLTLEKVTFVQPSSPCPLKSDVFQLHLVEGVNNDVLLSSLITAGHFFLQQPTHPSYPSLHRLNMMMNALYSSPEAPPLSDPVVDAVCVAPTMGGWYRAQIVSIDEQTASSYIRFLDYGGFLTINNSLLRQIRGDFLLLPFQAIECILANVVPAGGEGAEWSEEARQVVQYMTQQQVLQAQVYDYTESGIPLVYLYSTQTSQNGSLELVLINQDLVGRGYADMVVPATVEVQQ